eukprot:5928589-Prymnesium_polylepis.1
MHSWESLAKLLESDLTTGIICDVRTGRARADAPAAHPAPRTARATMTCAAARARAADRDARDAPQRHVQLPRHLPRQEGHRRAAQVFSRERRQLPRDALLHSVVHRPVEPRLRAARGAVPAAGGAAGHRPAQGTDGHLRCRRPRHRHL